MLRGRQEIDQTIAAGIRQTQAEINRDKKQRPNPFLIEEFFVFDLPPYDFGDGRNEPAPAKSYSEFKQDWNALAEQSR